MTTVTTAIEADLTYIGDRFQAGISIEVAANGMIVHVGPARRPADRRLRKRALLPGFVNAHSHAFQRALRGHGERFPRGAGSFWTWREAMYALVERLSPDGFQHICRQAFSEMLATGITTVGEFHYVHHANIDARDYALDARVLAAAREVGIRIVLLQSYYKTGAIGKPLYGGQRRFATPDLADFLAQFAALEKQLDHRTQQIGLAPHSIRAVPLDDFRALAAEAARRGLRLHTHLEEQRKEVAECEAEYGKRPMQCAIDELPVDAGYTAIHGTHTPIQLLEAWTGRGARVCLCPLTEGNLGDGIANTPTLAHFPGTLCIGTDSNARLDFFEEMRWLEYVQRVKREERGVVLIESEGNVATRLLSAATRGGADALGVAAGEIAVGRHADFIAIDLEHPGLADIDVEYLPDGLVFGVGAEVICGVCVAGTWVRSPE